MKAIGYCRVSTEGQAVDGVSLEIQQARISGWCDVNGYELRGVHRDGGASGARADNRPGLQAAISEACSTRAVLVVYSLSRLARSVKDTIALSERLATSGADLVSVTERIDTTSAVGKAFFRIMAVMNELERDQVSERTSAALAHLRTQGRRISGRIPFGFDLAEDGKSLTPNETEQEAIVVMRKLRLDGLSLRKIAAELERRGVSTKYGGTWTAQAVSGILKRQAA